MSKNDVNNRLSRALAATLLDEEDLETLLRPRLERCGLDKAAADDAVARARRRLRDAATSPESVLVRGVLERTAEIFPRAAGTATKALRRLLGPAAGTDDPADESPDGGPRR